MYMYGWSTCTCSSCSVYAPERGTLFLTLQSAHENSETRFGIPAWFAIWLSFRILMKTFQNFNKWSVKLSLSSRTNDASRRGTSHYWRAMKDIIARDLPLASKQRSNKQRRQRKGQSLKWIAVKTASRRRAARAEGSQAITGAKW